MTNRWKWKWKWQAGRRDGMKGQKARKKVRNEERRGGDGGGKSGRG